MVFGEKLKIERSKKSWSQEELAERLFVSRQAVSKWENGQNYPSIEVIIKISDLFGLTIDELLRSDEELKKKVIDDSKQLANPQLKFLFDLVFFAGLAVMLTKIGILILNRQTEMDIPLFSGTFPWNIGAIVLMVVGRVGSDMLKDKYKKE